MAFWNENSDERRRREDDNSSQNDRRGGFSFNEGNSFDERYSRGEFGDSSEDRERGRDRGYRGYGRRLDDIQPIREDLTGDLPPIGNPASVQPRYYSNPNVPPKAPSSYPVSGGYAPQPERPTGPQGGMNGVPMQGLGSNVLIYSPKTYADVQTLIDHLKRHEPVIIDFGKIGGDGAQRIVDFMSGAIYALSGNMQRISKTIFLLTPAGVNITVPVDQIRRDVEDKR